MNTNDKTLAGVQPGGARRLGDRAERARFEDWGRAEGLPLARGKMGGYAFEITAKAWRAWQHLSAPPSPTGQGDAHNCLAATLGHLRLRGWIDDVSGRMIDEAARKDMAAAALAARQRVRQEPVAVVGHDLTLHWTGKGSIVPLLKRHGIGPGSKLYSAPPAQAVNLGTGVQAIAIERERQLRVEGFSRDSDEQYCEGELARAAIAYAQLAAMDLQAGTRSHVASQEPPFFWPWALEWWKPVDARRDLVRAGALIAAQIDLIDSQAVANG
ncbi:TPA: hypothetical protein QDZ34_000883 [Stenotrophomonas maltophilia]|nr:hypothetical protein [Stenotrophomonas maltophilia]HDS1024615.1 hypothetical protein [Stenotrophomonas maltophilia]HDS1028999.1 hypothetical protein [Stenotrophomonas maltophilia]HDS1033567.1 hypothetical protein [Stenotrophomonas maltophilia]